MTQNTTILEVTAVTKKIKEEVQRVTQKERFFVVHCDTLNSHDNTYSVDIECRTICMMEDIKRLQNIQGLHIVYVESYKCLSLRFSCWYSIPDTKKKNNSIKQ